MRKFLLLLALLPYCTFAEDCAADEEEVVFTLFLDEDSGREQGWTMQCDGEVVWQVPVGILQETAPQRFRKNKNFVRDTACVKTTATCDFTIEDSYGDGLLHPGNYFLKYGANTIAVYDHAPFSEKSYCFGPLCPAISQEEAQTCDPTYLFFKLDANPSDTSYEVTCDEQIIWEGSGFEEPFEEFELDTCIEPYACCTLRISDVGNDGLTSSFDNDYGSVYLEWAYQRVFAYDGSNGYEFKAVEVDFGLGC